MGGQLPLWFNAMKTAEIYIYCEIIGSKLKHTAEINIYCEIIGSELTKL